MSTFQQQQKLKAKNNRGKSYSDRTDRETKKQRNRETDIENYNIEVEENFAKLWRGNVIHSEEFENLWDQDASETLVGQRNRKCSVDSSSIPYLQTGEGQLNDLLKRCSLKSLWPTLRQVRYLIPFGILE